MTEPAELLALMPFAETLGVHIDSASEDEVVGTLEYSKRRTTAGGLVHGGALMALADSVGAICAYLNLPEASATSTTSSHTVFLRGVRSGTVTATARPLHVGKSTIVVSTELRDNKDNRVAQVTQTQSVLTQ